MLIFCYYLLVSVYIVYLYTYICTYINLNIYDMYRDVGGIIKKCLNKTGQKVYCGG